MEKLHHVQLMLILPGVDTLEVNTLEAADLVVLMAALLIIARVQMEAMEEIMEAVVSEMRAIANE